MKTAITIIAVCEVIRTIQLTVDIAAGVINRKTVNNAIIDSIKQDEKELAKQLLEFFIKEAENESD